MADPVTLAFRPTPTSIGTLVLDASISETHAGEVDVTEHPVEKGANISDHARPKQDTLTIEGMVSNTPLNREQQRRVIDAFGVQVQTTAPAIAGAPGFAEQAYLALRALKDGGALITVVTSLRSYDQMLIVSLSVPRDGRTGDVLRFTATFRRILVVENKMTKVVITEQPSAQPTTNKGKQTAPTAPKEVKETLTRKIVRVFTGGSADKNVFSGAAG